jgi:flagellar biosynthesis/type III secretory pathway chaperone
MKVVKQSNIKNKNILNGFDKRINKLDEIVEGDNYQ